MRMPQVVVRQLERSLTLTILIHVSLILAVERTLSKARYRSLCLFVALEPGFISYFAANWDDMLMSHQLV